MTARELSEEPGIKDSTLRRWSCERKEMGGSASPGNGSPKINKDYEIVKLRKRVEELERKNGLLKISGPSRVKAMRETQVPQGA